MKEIPLINSTKKILVDDKHYDKVTMYRWHVVSRQGIIRMSTWPQERLANFIKNDYINKYDHKDRNKFNNLEENLRIATHSQNKANSDKYDYLISCTSRYKGVSWKKKNKNWIAQIRYNNKQIHLGSFQNEEEAARAYDLAAVKYHGEFACLNFPTT